jgi:hypothetical protein
MSTSLLYNLAVTLRQLDTDSWDSSNIASHSQVTRLVDYGKADNMPLFSASVTGKGG